MTKFNFFWLLLLTAILQTATPPADAQQPSKIPRIGWLTGGRVTAASNQIFRQALRELGYVEGKNMVIEVRAGEGQRDQVVALAAELVRLKVDVIVTAGATDTRAAKNATSTIPIVMTKDGDPIGNGFIASLARPGGNITGLSTVSPELSGKRLEILKDIAPNQSRVAVFGTSNSAINAQELKELELAAPALALKLHYFDVLLAKDLEPAFQGATKERLGAVLMNVSGGIIGGDRRAPLAEMAAKSRLPVIYHRREYVEQGGLASYGPNMLDLTKRAATYVDRY